MLGTPHHSQTIALGRLKLYYLFALVLVADVVSVAATDGM